jgi:hypothetical protein
MNDGDEDPALTAAIEAEVARALGAGAEALPAEVREELACLLRLGLRHHTGARAILDQLRPAPSVERSDEVATAAFQAVRRTRGER